MRVFKISNILNLIDIDIDMSATAVYNIYRSKLLESMKPAYTVVK